jgi:ferritin
MTKHEEAREMVKEQTNSSRKWLQQYIDETEESEKTHQNLFAHVKRYFELKNCRYRTDDDEIELEFLRLELSVVFFGKKGGEGK